MKPNLASNNYNNKHVLLAFKWLLVYNSYRSEIVKNRHFLKFICFGSDNNENITREGFVAEIFQANTNLKKFSDKDITKESFQSDLDEIKNIEKVKIYNFNIIIFDKFIF